MQSAEGHGACDAFCVDMCAKQSGMCVCGFARLAHSRLFAAKRPSLELKHAPPPSAPLGAAASSIQLYAATGNRACAHFDMDMVATKVGMCVCGFARLDHVKLISGSEPAVAASINATAQLQARLRDLGFSPMPSDVGTAAARSVASLTQPVRDALLYIMQCSESAEVVAKTTVVSASLPPLSSDVERRREEEKMERKHKEEEARTAAATAKRWEDDARRAAEAKQRVEEEKAEWKLQAEDARRATQLKRWEDEAARLKEEEERKCKEDAARRAIATAQAEQERKEEDARRAVEAEQRLKEEVAARMRNEETGGRAAAAAEAERKRSEDEARTAAGVKQPPPVTKTSLLGAPVAQVSAAPTTTKIQAPALFGKVATPILFTNAPVDNHFNSQKVQQVSKTSSPVQSQLFGAVVAPATNKIQAPALFANVAAPSLFANTSAGSQISGQKVQQVSKSSAAGSAVKRSASSAGNPGMAQQASSRAPMVVTQAAAPEAVSSGDTSNRKYSLEQLKHYRQTDALDDLDIAKKDCLEEYLKEEDFFKTFGMPPVEFSKLPAWKRQQAKKKAGIF